MPRIISKRNEALLRAATGARFKNGKARKHKAGEQQRTAAGYQKYIITASIEQVEDMRGIGLDQKKTPKEVFYEAMRDYIIKHRK